MIEIIHDHCLRGHIRFAVFDMDGTLSLLREGWQEVMVSAMMAELLRTPAHEGETELHHFVTELVTQTTGQTASYQLLRLADEVRKRGGLPEHPSIYKDRYLARLDKRIGPRIEALKAGRVTPEEMMVPGSQQILDAMRARGVRCYLVSGTYKPYVFDEADALQITPYFSGIYGGLDDPARFSKRQFLHELVTTYLLDGYEVVSLGDGITEIKEAKDAGGIAVGVASNEATRSGIDAKKRELLVQAGADIIVPDFREHQELIAYLFDA
jgi:phosphoglycolate phosphatase-like HAD superfamily hydrolase